MSNTAARHTNKCVLCKWNNHSKAIKISHQLLGNHVTTCVYFVESESAGRQNKWSASRCERYVDVDRVYVIHGKPRSSGQPVDWPRGGMGEWSAGNYRWGGTKCANNVLNIAANELQDCKMKDYVGRHQMTVSYNLGIYR